MIYRFTHLPLISTVPWYGGVAAALRVTKRARLNGTILMGWEDWERPPHMHSASEMNRKVGSDARSSKQAQPVISGRQDQQLWG